jgi:hypothetical protein
MKKRWIWKTAFAGRFNTEMSMKKRWVWAVVSMVCAMPALSAYGQDIGGEMTPEVRWYIEGGTLYLCGEGVVPTTMLGDLSPWHAYRSQFDKVVIEEGITEVGKNVFNGYRNVTSLTVAGSVRMLGYNSFSACGNLATVEVKSAVPPSLSNATFILSKPKRAKLIVPDGCTAEYREAPFWNKFGRVEESGRAATDAEEVNRMLDTSCVVILYREPRFSGGGAGLSVYLNGVKQEKLRNGEVIRMKTDRLKNRIVIKWHKSNMGYFCFDAIPGGRIQINYSAATTNFMMEE